MTDVSVVCHVPKGSASLALQAMLTVLNIPGVTTIDANDDDDGDNNNDHRHPSMTVTTVHALTNVPTVSLTACAWLSTIRALCSLVPTSTMWGNQNPSYMAQIEAWMEDSIHTLIPILQTEKKKESVFRVALLDYAQRVDGHLFRRDQTYLVSDVPTAVDVCAAIWLRWACAAVSLDALPMHCYRWCMTMTQHPLLSSYTNDCPTPQQGPATLSQKPKTTPATPPAVAAPAPAAAAPTPPAAPAPAPPPTPAPAPPPPTPAPTTTTGEFVEDADNVVLKKLGEYGLDYRLYSHEVSMTAEDLVSNVPLSSDKETHTKNLFFKDKKHGLFLVTVATSSHVNTKALGQNLGLSGKVNLRLADAKTLDECLGVKPGSVGPLCIVHDTPKKVTLVLDNALLQQYEKIHSHPLRNDKSVVMTPNALMEYIQKTDHEPIMLDFDTPSAPTPTPTPPPAAAPPKVEKKKKAAPESNKKGGKKGETLLALQWKKEENFAMWYSDVIVLSEMISYYDISGCYILRPWSFKIWELIQEWFNKKIGALGVENSYFPLFVSRERLEREKDHVEGFAPEVAWVTKSGDGDLAKPIAIRPTSETIMYPAFSDWIRSHRDLPLKLNQWSNVVRWEFKYPTPFLRSREFLWQEGHTAHSTYEDADAMVQDALELYRGVYEDLLAVPVVKGFKTEKEKFAGGHQTTTVEAYIPIAGRAIQGATSHNLGQNFGKMFDIQFQDETGKSQVAWQTSWGLTTRTIGVMIMVHGDDTGLVLPPRVSPLQAVVVPILSKRLTPEDANPYCEAIVADLQASGIRVKYDDRTMYNPGWKYNHWEQKGVPLRIEVGPRDMEQNQARVVVRFNGDKMDLPVANLGERLQTELDAIQRAMLDKARVVRDAHLVRVTEWKDFCPNLEKHNLVLTPWCGPQHKDWEDHVKEKSRAESLQARGEDEEDTRTSTSVAAKTLCIPFDQPELPPGTKCFASGLDATCWILWGRSY